MSSKTLRTDPLPEPLSPVMITSSGFCASSRAGSSFEEELLVRERERPAPVRFDFFIVPVWSSRD